MLRRTALALVAGVSLALAFEPAAAAFLIPPAVAGFFLAARGLSARRGFVVGFVFGLAFYALHIWWMRAVATSAWLGLSTAEALFYGVLGAGVAVLSRHRLWPVWAAAAWVVVEVVRSSWPFSGMPWGRLAFGTVDTPVAAALPYVGMVGVSLLLALSGALLARLVVAEGARDRLVALGCLGALVVAVAVPALAPYDAGRDGEATVAVVQGDVPGPGNDILYDHRQVTENHVTATEELADRVRAGTAEAPDFVLWPENSTAVDPFRDDGINAAIRRAVEAIGVPVLVGAIVDAGEEHVLNQGIVWDPVTGAGERYTKWHPVAYGEYIPLRRYADFNFGELARIRRDMLSGSREQPLDIAGVAVADAICFDVAYDDGIRAQVQHGAELLVVQTSNATFIHTDQIDQQFAITRLRALETGKWTLVAATNGVSGVVAPDGHVVASADPRTQEVLVETVGLARGTTPGVRLGPWVAGGSAVVTAVGLVLVAVPYRRRRRATPSPQGEVRPLVTTSGE